MSAKHHTWQWQQLANAVTQAANNNPDHRCRRCGLTKTEAEAAGMPNPQWDAGHPDHPGAPIAAEHASCNRSAGATRGNHRRNHGYNWP